MKILEIRVIPVILFFSLFNVTCSKVKNDTAPPIKKESIKGLVQKGPFVNGTQVVMAELTTDLIQTGKVFSTQITDNTGAFELKDLELNSSFVQFSANGFYYNEVAGALSTAQLNLTALSDISDQNSINVNVLTELERKRVEKLVSMDSGFSVAKSKAQKEILAIFGFEGVALKSSETLNITGNSEGNAILLAISVLLQGNRQDAQLTEFIAAINNDLKDDGILSGNALRDELRRTAVLLNPGQIRTQLEARYQELGAISIIPDFEKYITMFLNYSATEPSSITQPATEVAGRTALLNATVNPNNSPTVVSFIFGKTTDYTDSVIVTATAVNGKEALPFNTLTENLDALTTYHFRVKAENSFGTTYGQDQTFTTIEHLPTLITETVTDVSFTSAIGTASIPSEGTNPILKRGFIWSRSPNTDFDEGLFGDNILDTFQDSSVVTNGPAQFSGPIKPMFSNMTFYIKAYALTKDGFGYGNEITVTTKPYFTSGGGVSDIEGNTYPTVVIGTQEWMKANLHSTKFSNGDTIGIISDETLWKDFNNAPYYYPSEDFSIITNKKLYNVYAMQDSRNVCSTGWHVPSEGDWQILETYLGMPSEELNLIDKSRGISEYVGHKMKSITANWDNTQGITDDSGFSAIPTTLVEESNLIDSQYFAFFWTTDGSYRRLDYNSAGVFKGSFNDTQGLSIRCVKN